MIYVNGDSWSRNLWIDWSPIDWCWAKQMSDIINHPIVNESAGCGSNFRIIDKILMSHAQGNRYDLAIIGLTCPQRWYLPSKLFSYWNIGPTILEEKEYRHDSEIYRWFVNNCIHDANFILSYYKTIWQIHEICNVILRCPVMFFNAWYQPMLDFHEHIFSNKDEIDIWSRLPEHNLSSFESENLNSIMCFLHNQSANWLIDMQPWSKLLTDVSDKDQYGDRDPDHPSQTGHKKIALHVLSAIEKKLPDLYKQLDKSQNQDNF